jgi:hypothetical protein
MAEWTIHVVAARFCEAARTAHRLPPVRVQGFFNVWPPFLRTEFEQMACEAPPHIICRPTPTEVERMLEVMHWVQWLEVEQRRLVWMRAERYRWKEIAKRFGFVPRTAQRHWHIAMHTVASHLRAEN